MSTRTKVLRLLPQLDFGGVESRVIIQSRLYDREQFDLRVVALDNFGEAATQIESHGVPVDILGVSPSIRQPATTVRLAQYLRRIRPDVLHASISEGIFHGAIAGLLAKVPVRIVEEVGVPNRSELAQDLFSELYSTTDAVVAVAEVTRKILEEEGAPGERLHRIYNCASPVFFPEQREARVFDKPLRFLAVGRLVPVKNHERLLRAFKLALESCPGIELSIAGEGPLRPKLEATIDELQLAPHVRLLGFRRDVAKLMKQHHVFVLPSVSEGCSISLVESMASGMIPLGSRALGILEVMECVGEGLNVPFDSIDHLSRAIVRLARLDSEELGMLSERARERAYDDFSPQTYVDKVEALYRSLYRRRDDR